MKTTAEFSTSNVVMVSLALSEESRRYRSLHRRAGRVGGSLRVCLIISCPLMLSLYNLEGGGGDSLLVPGHGEGSAYQLLAEGFQRQGHAARGMGRSVQKLWVKPGRCQASRDKPLRPEWVGISSVQVSRAQH